VERSAEWGPQPAAIATNAKNRCNELKTGQNLAQRHSLYASSSTGARSLGSFETAVTPQSLHALYGIEAEFLASGFIILLLPYQQGFGERHPIKNAPHPASSLSR
jgi:hypothetical protein